MLQPNIIASAGPAGIELSDATSVKVKKYRIASVLTTAHEVNLPVPASPPAGAGGTTACRCRRDGVAVWASRLDVHLNSRFMQTATCRGPSNPPSQAHGTAPLSLRSHPCLSPSPWAPWSVPISNRRLEAGTGTAASRAVLQRCATVPRRLQVLVTLFCLSGLCDLLSCGAPAWRLRGGARPAR